ncbi:DUF3850 domain-containing protein [Aeromonas salmonicida subsp. salmonicida]|uniref:ASCH/PUA domain-containing protein n=1 Tax=Aeromonas salmonicida TaxID=645 RepID=UPI0009373869|nr:ASCH/PUA domain-containing protein [Aeromonas salmonicida]ELI6443103.1 DUF3850 domain-containing protein [Aeromonas salmonicida subsp. salmonicida]OKA85911.1 hypothetical protein BHR43_17635 [Aeromonas salmonicida subsp. salmonicida]OKA88488.1 hypothetical protein BHR44_05915 [Aeromonas salmonicida subsp. salmonicida]OKA91199.1 hypothetical protein BHR45_06170 [Aeromonas salmonicida subsp. salmonicida]
MKHELKIKPEYFAAVFFGEKTFEICNNADRNFQVGDTLLLKAWDGEFTGDFVEKVVSYITDFEQKPGYVVLGLVNHREHELLEKFHRTGVAIERAISTGSVLADHPLKSRLELLANHHEREMKLVAQLSDATRQCGVMAGLLCELRDGVEGEWCFPVNLDERIDAALAGKLPDQPLDMVSLSDIASLQRYTLGGHCDSFGQDCGSEMEQDDEGEYVLLADALMLAADKKLEHATHNLDYVQGASDFKQELLKSTKAFAHPHIEGVFAVFNNLHEHAMLATQNPQGGESCATASPSSSPD